MGRGRGMRRGGAYQMGGISFAGGGGSGPRATLRGVVITTRQESTAGTGAAGSCTADAAMTGMPHDAMLPHSLCDIDCEHGTG